jgi:two-component system NtrC family sensor kinase
MRRLLKLRTWKLRGTGAAESSMIVAIACLAIPLLLFAGASWMARDEAYQQAEERMSRTLDLLYVNVRTTFETEYLVAANVAELVDDYSNDDIRKNAEKVHEGLKRLVDPLPQVDNVWVIDEAGKPLVTGRVYPLPPGLDYSDRAYFIAHRDGKVQRYVTEALRGRLRGVEFFQYSERRRKPDGGFNGVIAVSIAPSYFTDQFARASNDKDFTASIIRADGEFLARFPAAGAPTRLGPDTGFMRAIAGQPEQGRYVVDAGAVDGASRIFMYRKLPDVPIYVVHGMTTASIRSAWLSRMGSHLIFGLPATLGLFLLAVLASRRALQESNALERLRQEQLRRETAGRPAHRRHRA